MSRLVDIAKLNMGQSPPSSSYNDDGNGLPFYQGKTDFGFIHPVPRKYCNSPNKIAKAGDILISVRAPVGPVNIADSDCCIGRGIAGISTITFDQLFIYFNLIYQADYIASLGTGSTFKAINKSQLESINIPDCPFPEQRKIAYVLSTVQKAIEQQDKLIRHTTELKKALMQKLFTEGTKGEKQKQTEIGLVPESWEVTTIGEIADVSSGGTPSRKEIKFWDNGNIPWVKTGEVNYCIITNTEEYITELGLNNSSAKLYSKGTLLMAMYGQGITRGKVAILGINATINQACAAITPMKNSNIFPEYLYYFFEHNYDYIRSLSHGANQKNLSGNIIKDIEVSYPKDITTQSFITSSLNRFDEKKLVHQKKKETLTDLFKTLLHELMTGQRRVHDIDFPVAEALESTSKKYKTKEQPLSMAAEK